MSENNSNKPQEKSDSKKINESQNRSASPNPFLQFISTSPSNNSPRSDENVSPRSPRFQNGGVSIGNGSPRDSNGSPRDMFTGGKFSFHFQGVLKLINWTYMSRI